MRVTPKIFLGLAAGAAIALGAAGVVYTTNDRWSSGQVTGAKLFPALKERANDVATLEIRHGEKELTITREKEQWVAQGHYDYPVKTENVRSLVVRLAQAELIEPKTRNPDRFDLLDLNDPEAATSKARRIQLRDKDGTVVAGVVVGRKRWDAFGSGKSGTYVRLPDDQQTWLANVDLELNTEIKGWIESKVFATEKGKIRSLTLESKGEEPLKISRDEAKENAFTLEGTAPDDKKKEKSPSLDSVVGGFASIEIDDLRKLKMSPGGNGVSLARLELEGGLVVKLRHRKQNAENWITIQAEGSGEAAERADAINTKVKNWEFKIPTWKADAMFKRRSDFFETS